MEQPGRYIEYARLCLSGATAELSLPIAAVEENPAFSSAKHQLFMSASIKDGSPLVRDLALDPAALRRIVQPPSDRGAGERMILPISLIDPKLTNTTIAKACADLSKNVNVVVLTSSAKQANTWTQAGATFSKKTDVTVFITFEAPVTPGFALLPRTITLRPHKRVAFRA